MRLQFDKSGRRFFFLTFCVRGRKPVLEERCGGLALDLVGFELLDNV